MLADMTHASRSDRDNQVVRLARNCWLPVERTDLVERCAAILSSSADDTVIASVTAAQLHALWLPPMPETIHIATATAGRRGRSMTRTKRPEFVNHRFQLGGGDTVCLDGVILTSLARTWLDLARVLSLPDLVAAGDSALRSGATRDQLRDVLDRLPPSHRPRRATRALPLLDERSRSRPETHLRMAVSAADLPAFDVNEPVYRNEGGWLAEPDLSLPEARLALEYLGVDHAEVARMRRDRTRTVDMHRDLWTVLEYGPAEVFGRPDLVQHDVRQHLRRHAPHLLGRRRRDGHAKGLRVAV